jgi:hypothetical protein
MDTLEPQGVGDDDEQPYAFSYSHRLPRSRPVDRRSFVADLVRDQTVIDIGFVDYPLLEERLRSKGWLHGELASRARSIVGIDRDPQGVDWANEHGFTAHVADVQSPEEIRRLGLEPAEIVTACELIEHLDCPGLFLESVKSLCAGRLVLTTPNAYRPLNTLAALTGRELIHPHHTALHSPRTLTRLLEMNGWQVEWLGYYREEPSPLTGGPAHSLAIGAVNVIEAVQSSRLFPFLSNGLIVIARRS